MHYSGRMQATCNMHAMCNMNTRSNRFATCTEQACRTTHATWVVIPFQNLNTAKYKHQLEHEGEVFLSVDHEHIGLGGDTAWNRTVHSEYFVRPRAYCWGVCIRAVTAGGTAFPSQLSPGHRRYMPCSKMVSRNVARSSLARLQRRTTVVVVLLLITSGILWLFARGLGFVSAVISE